MHTTSILRCLFLSAAVSSASAASAQSAQDPSTGGQLNQCWGQIASQIAKLDTSGVDANGGGGMGIHSRAAAGQGTTFGDAFGFNTGIGFDPNTGQTVTLDNKGRTGVGNVSKGAPHNAHPGDGGNGQHAINNSNDSEANTTTDLPGFSNLINPLTGRAPDPTLELLKCDLVP